MFETIAHTPFQAPSTLKLVIEVTVFGLEVLLKTIGLLLVLLLPTWAGLVYVMAKRSREGYYVDITPEGVSIGSPVDRFFVKKEDITIIQPSKFFPAIAYISIYCGRRRVSVRKLVPAIATPQKKPLASWLRAKSPERSQVREGMLGLKRSLEALMVNHGADLQSN